MKLTDLFTPGQIKLMLILLAAAATSRLIFEIVRIYKPVQHNHVVHQIDTVERMPLLFPGDTITVKFVLPRNYKPGTEIETDIHYQVKTK